MGAAMLLSGVVTAIATLPILDRILTHHMGITSRILSPFIAVSWVALIGAGKEVLLPFSLGRWSKLAHHSEGT